MPAGRLHHDHVFVSATGEPLRDLQGGGESMAQDAVVPHETLQREIGIVTVLSPSHCTTSGSFASAIDSSLTSLPVP
jgi:hypothetical protein